MRVVIVDDERLARERLARLLAIHPDVQIIGEAADGLAALEAITTLKPDTVFLDIQMPALTGLEVAAAIPPTAAPAVVFVTAYDQYALQAFSVNAVDYLMKPVEEDRLAITLSKLRTRTSHENIEKLIAALHQRKDHSLQRIVGKHLNRLHVLPIETIEAFITSDELVFAITPNGRFLIERTLRDLEALLPTETFARVHKQTIVNLEKLTVLEPIAKGGASARLRCGEIIEISRRYAQDLRQRLGW